MTTINYKTKVPVVYNKGSEHECYRDTFLAYYTYESIEEAKINVNEINKTHPACMINGYPIDWNEIDYFFVGDQKLFDTRDSFGAGDWR